MFKRLFCAAIALASLCSCAPEARSPAIVWHGDTAFTVGERECVEDAAAQWYVQTDGKVNYSLEWDYDRDHFTDVIKHRVNNRISRWAPTESQVVDSDAKAYPNLLLGKTNGVDITQRFARPMEIGLVADRFQDQLLCKNVAMHEFGHTLGIDHVHVAGHAWALMAPSPLPRSTACAKQVDLDAFCLFTNCEGLSLVPCKEGPAE